MGVDVRDLGGGDTRVGESDLHATYGAIALRVGSGDVVRVSRRCRADHLGEDGRAAFVRVIPVLDDQDPRPFAHDETVAGGVKGTRVAFVAECGHVAKARFGDLDDDRLGATGDHDGTAPTGDETRGVADRVGARGARRGDGFAWSTESEAHRHGGRGGVGHHHGNHEG